MGDDSDSLDERLKNLFGTPIHSYTDEQAIEDGVLIPFRSRRREDTGHRITRRAFVELRRYYQRSYPNYGRSDFQRFFLAELLPLVPFAKRRWADGGILKTRYDFRVSETAQELIWYVPNEQSGITMMLPSDY